CLGRGVERLTFTTVPSGSMRIVASAIARLSQYIPAKPIRVGPRTWPRADRTSRHSRIPAIEVFQERPPEFLMAAEAAELHLFEGADDSRSVLTLRGFGQRRGGVVGLAVVSPEFGCVRSHEAQDARSFGHRGPRMVSDEARGLLDEFPVFSGNAVRDRLHVSAQVFHDFSQRQSVTLAWTVLRTSRTAHERDDQSDCE